MHQNDKILRYLLSTLPPGREETTYERWLASLRLPAVRYLQERGLPNKKSEAYRYTPLRPYLRRLLLPEAALSDCSASPRSLPWATLATPPLQLPAMDPNGSHPLFRFLNFSEGYAVAPDLLRGSVATYRSDDPFVALNTAHLVDGTWLHVSANASVGSLLLPTPQQVEGSTCHSRRLITLEPASRATLIEDASLAAPLLHNATTEIHIGSGAQLDYYLLHTGRRPSQAALHHTFVTQAAKSHFRHYTLTTTPGLTRSALTVYLRAPQSHAEIYGAYIAQERSHQENHVAVHHEAPQTTSTTLYKGIAASHATAVFHGALHVHPGAPKSCARQHHHGWLLDPTAHIYAQPRLAIQTADVVCTHGATTRKTDPAILSYLLSRAIPPPYAHRLLLDAFFQELLDYLPSDLSPFLHDHCIAPFLEKLHPTT